MEKTRTIAPQHASAYKRNLVLLAIITARMIAGIWIGSHAFLRFDHQSAIREHHRTMEHILAYRAQTVATTIEKNRFAMIMLEEAMAERNFELIDLKPGKNLFKDNKQPSHVSLLVENTVIFYGGEAVLVSGFLEPDFKKENRAFAARDPALGKELTRMEQDLRRSASQPRVIRHRIRYGDRDLLLAAAGIPLQNKYSAMVLYSDIAQVLAADGVDNRARITYYTASGSTAFLLAVSLFVLYNIRRDRRAFSALKTLSEELTEEVRERQYTEERLRQSQATLKGIFRAAPIGIGTINQGFLGWINDSMCRITGYSQEAIKGCRADLFFTSEQAFRTFRDAMAGSMKQSGAASTETQLRHSGGQMKHALVHASFIDADEPDLGIIFTVVDVSDQRAATRALRDSETRFRSLLENLADGVFCHDLDGRIILVNNAACAMTGYAREELLAMNVEDIDAGSVDRDDRGAFWLSMKHSEYVTVEAEHKRRDGSVYPVEVRLNRLTLEDRPVILALARDVSNRLAAEEETRRLQRQLVQAQKMEAVGRLAGGIAHDFNNMLAVIMGSAELALMDTDPGHPNEEELREITNAAERARDLTMKLLAFARKEKLRLRPLSVRRIIEDLMPVLERTVAKRVSINLLDLCDVSVAVDKTQIHQALLNICINAADAMPEGGEISISAINEHVSSAHCDTCGQPLHGDFCRIRITDTGPGMPDEIRARVFEPFFTTKEAGKGTGLGLSVTHGIVTSHNGHIMIHSRPGRGVSMDIFLPYSGDVAGIRQESAPDDASAWSGTETVLVIDDEAHVLATSRRMLESMGYNPLPAPRPPGLRAKTVPGQGPGPRPAHGIGRRVKRRTALVPQYPRPGRPFPEQPVHSHPGLLVVE